MKVIPVLRVLLVGSLVAILLSLDQVFAAEFTPESEPPDAIQQMLSEERVALVMGNADYRQWPPLANPVNDARVMAETLKRFGFTVTIVENGSKEQMENAVRAFGAQARRGGVALFFYAGHGSQYRGQNYLIPVDADILAEDDIEARSVSARSVLNRMGKANNRLNIVILDACRTLPIRRLDRDAVSGLAPMKASGTLIAYATAPNFVAKDGKGNNSPYTKALLESINKHPGLKLEDLLKTVRAAVLRETGGVQEPWIESSIGGDFYFDPKRAGSSTVIYNPAPPAEDTERLNERSAQIPRWREVGAGFFSQTTEEFTEDDVRIALALQSRLDALNAKIMKWAHDPVIAMTSTSLNTAIAHAQVECYRLIATKQLSGCDASLRRVEGLNPNAEATPQADRRDDKGSDDTMTRMAEAIVEASRTGTPSMVLVPYVFGSYNGSVTQAELNRGWSYKQRLAVICMDAFSKRDVSPERHKKCQDESPSIDALVSSKRLEEADRRLTRLARDLGE